MKLKFLNILIILSLLYFIMSNGNNFSQIEYCKKIIIKYDKTLTYISFKIIKK